MLMDENTVRREIKPSWREAYMSCFPSSRLPGAMGGLRCSGATNSATNSCPGRKRNCRRRFRIPHAACLPPATAVVYLSQLAVGNNLRSSGHGKVVIWKYLVRFWGPRIAQNFGFQKPSARDGLTTRNLFFCSSISFFLLIINRLHLIGRKMNHQAGIFKGNSKTPNSTRNRLGLLCLNF